MTVGIEAINAYTGRLALDVQMLFDARGLDARRFGNLMMVEKSVNLPCEDSVTNAVNAARPLTDRLTEAERDRIELVIVGSESGIDFGKPISTYVHDYLGLGRHCRSFEVKHACYGGTAALQTAAALVATSPVPGAKALVIASDAASAAARDTYWEPSQGAGAVAMLVGDRPDVLELDVGANGYYSHEVMDTCRPCTGVEAGDADLSLLSYLEALEQSFSLYRRRVAGVDLADSFDYLVFHTPFAGMVKGAHRQLMRRHARVDAAVVEADFDARVTPSLTYCKRVGNVYSAALYLALCSLIDHVRIDVPKRIALFSYGSGCAAEFYSGVVSPAGQTALAAHGIADQVAARRALSMPEYERLVDLAVDWMGGIESKTVDRAAYADIYDAAFAGRGLLVLDRIRSYHREYVWS